MSGAVLSSIFLQVASSNGDVVSNMQKIDCELQILLTLTEKSISFFLDIRKVSWWGRYTVEPSKLSPILTRRM